MKYKSCDSFFCSNKCPEKYRYCYKCANRKGLTGNNNSIFVWIVILIILLMVI